MVKKKAYIGINYDGCHDSAVALLADEVEYVGVEERFSRHKKDGRQPSLSLEYLEKNYDLDKYDITYALPILTPSRSKSLWLESGLNQVYESILADQGFAYDYANGISGDKVYVGHHMSHAASAYFTSGFKGKSLICTIDAGNFFSPYSENLYEADNGKISNIYESPSVEIASSYLIITAVLGFKPLRHEGKVTGLAAFGKYNEPLEKELHRILATPDIVSRVTKWENLGGTDTAPVLKVTEGVKLFESITKKYSKEDIAYAIQNITEKKVLELLKPYVRDYDRICLAGGLFANVALNKKVKDLGFKEIYIHPAMGDDGLALGAALFAKSLDETLHPFRLKNSFFGARLNVQDLEAELLSQNLKFKKVSNIESLIAKELAAGKIVARVAGRAEYGPRALGHRSILARADDASLNKTLNAKLNRTEFMPFAPVVEAQQAKELFIGLSGTEYAAEFMTITLECSDKMKRIAPAAVHVDGTARPQIVYPHTDSSYYKIISEYYMLTKGESVLINTSYNLHGEPIVQTIEDAIQSFLTSQLDYLAIEDYLIYE